MTQPPESSDQPSNDPSSSGEPPSYPTYPSGGAESTPPGQPGAYPPPSGPGGYPPPASPGSYPPPSGGYGAPQQTTNQLAMWSMITGILAIVLGIIGACGVVAGPVAIGLGIPGKRQVMASGGYQKGAGMATAGLVLGGIGTALSIMWIILFSTGVIELPDFGG